LEVMSSAPPENVEAVELRPQDGVEQAPERLTGVLHVYVAFDWGEEILLERARSLVPAEVCDLPRRRRTPASIAYRPAPLRIRLPCTAEPGRAGTRLSAAKAPCLVSRPGTVGVRAAQPRGDPRSVAPSHPL